MNQYFYKRKEFFTLNTNNFRSRTVPYITVYTSHCIRLFRNTYLNIHVYGHSKTGKLQRSLKISYFLIMSSIYFQNLAIQSRELDDGIERLNMVWNRPHILINGFEECNSETNSHIDALWNSISDTQKGIEETLFHVEEFESHDPVTVEQFIQETEEEYETIKTECDNLNIALAEYGYRYVDDNTLNQTNQNDDTTCEQHSIEKGKNLEVKFMAKHNESMQMSNESYLSQTFTTPVISRLASVSIDNSMAHKRYMSTPIIEPPQEPIYSKHFYDISKK